jgi:hypothetical protein
LAKGGDFELEMTKRLSLWITDGERNDVFRRGRRGGRGDITFRDPIGKPLIDAWNIECKTGYSKKSKATAKRKKKITNWCILDPIDSRGSSTVLQDFWDQCVRDADETNREPILIFRRPYMNACISFRQSVFNRIVEFYGPCNGQYIIANIFGETLAIINLEQFLDWVPDPVPIFILRLVRRE